MKRRVVDYALPCPEVDCENGQVLVEVSGGRFDSRQGQWFPAEQVEVCKTCSGTGEVYASEMDWLTESGHLDFRNAIDNYAWSITRHDVRRIYEQPPVPRAASEEALPW